MEPLKDEQFERLLQFRVSLRRFNAWSDEQAKEVGLTHRQHQLLLAVKASARLVDPTIGQIAELLLLRHHSTVELVDRVVALGLVSRRRDPADRRLVRLRLTDEGEDRIDRLTALHLEELRRLAPSLGFLLPDEPPPDGPQPDGPLPDEPPPDGAVGPG